MSGPPPTELAGTSVLVTGGTGFLGAYVIPALVLAGCRVTVVGVGPVWREPLNRLVRDGAVRLVTEREWWRPTSVRRIVREAPAASDLIHLAYTPVPPGSGSPAARARHEVAVNLRGTTELVAALEGGLRHVVFASSIKVYGRGRLSPVDESMRPEPADVYGAAKLAAEDQLRAIAGAGGPLATVLRFTTLYGPMETVPRAVPNFIRAGLAGIPATIRGNGQERRDYLHVSDAAQLVLKALARPPMMSRVLIGGSGTAIRTVELAHRIRDLVASRGGRLPPPPEHVDALPAADLLCRTDRAAEELAFRPTVRLNDGLADEVDWLMAHPSA